MAEASLLARFRLVDEMSQRMAEIAESGRNMTAQWEQAGGSLNTALGDVGAAAADTASRIDGV
ncbi:MAG: hypothetical protein OSJ64_00025, partial [Firmicutes bacterium]|nr:hypothetical protein [Bacillota bacterium]